MIRECEGDAIFDRLATIGFVVSPAPNLSPRRPAGEWNLISILKLANSLAMIGFVVSPVTNLSPRRPAGEWNIISILQSANLSAFVVSPVSNLLPRRPAEEWNFISTLQSADVLVTSCGVLSVTNQNIISILERENNEDNCQR